MEKFELGFEPKTHTYFNKFNKKEKLKSVTTLVEKVGGKFNTHYWAMYTGLKNNGKKVGFDKYEDYIKVDDIKVDIDTLYNIPAYKNYAETTKKEWLKKNKEANERGNKIHDNLEYQINKSRNDVEAKDNKKVIPLNKGGYLEIKSKNDLDATNLGEYYPRVYNDFIYYIKLGCVIFAEKKIYNVEFLTAGTIDVLIVKGKKFAIYDWKTNKDEMKFVSGYYKKEKTKNGIYIKSDNFIETNDKLSKPVNHLPSSKGIKYSLQLSIYAFMMEQWGYTLVSNGLVIYHIRPEKNIRLDIKYYKKEARDILKHFKKPFKSNNSNSNYSDQMKLKID